MNVRSRTATSAVIALVAAATLLCSATAAQAVSHACLGVDFISAKQGWVVGTSGILHTANGGATWRVQKRPGGALLIDVCVLRDGRHGWAVGETMAGDPALYRTTNGGTWTRITSMTFSPGSQFTSVKFANASTGWACASARLPASPWGGIYGTSDGGRTWALQASWSNVAPVAVDSINPWTASATGFWDTDGTGTRLVPVVMDTTDGTDWSATPRSLDRAEAPATAYTSDIDLAVGTQVIVGDYGGYPFEPFIFSSSNYGGDFAWFGPAAGPKQLEAVHMVTSRLGYAVGTDAAALLKTGNAGVTWSVKRTGYAKYLYGVDFVSSTTGYAVGQHQTSRGVTELVVKTTNGARSWRRVR